MLFAPELATGLFSHFIAAISGGNLYRKASYLEDALGQTLFPEWLSLDERPHIPRALGSASYDGDGLATYAKPFVENGRLISYVLSTYSGRKLACRALPTRVACTTCSSATVRKIRLPCCDAWGAACW